MRWKQYPAESGGCSDITRTRTETTKLFRCFHAISVKIIIYIKLLYHSLMRVVGWYVLGAFLWCSPSDVWHNEAVFSSAVVVHGEISITVVSCPPVDSIIVCSVRLQHMSSAINRFLSCFVLYNKETIINDAGNWMSKPAAANASKQRDTRNTRKGFSPLRRCSIVQKIVIENSYSLVEVTCCVIDSDVKLTSQVECFT